MLLQKGKFVPKFEKMGNKCRLVEPDTHTEKYMNLRMYYSRYLSTCGVKTVFQNISSQKVVKPRFCNKPTELRLG